MREEKILYKVEGKKRVNISGLSKFRLDRPEGLCYTNPRVQDGS